MQWILASVVSVVAIAPQGQDNEAEKLFRSMERKVRAAKSLTMACDVRGTLRKGDEHVRVTAKQQFHGASTKWFFGLLV